MIRTTAKEFIQQLRSQVNKEEIKNVQRFFRDKDPDTKFLGIRMQNIFSLAKKFMAMPVNEIAKLLQSEYYEVRIGAVSIMDFKARAKNVFAGNKERPVRTLYKEARQDKQLGPG